jgi:membrane-anchored protein YejM (alkaline phosphatase superfamily)
VKISSISEVKKELQELEPKLLVELCLSLAKYKKDNKEYLGYLLFESHDKTSFVNDIKAEMDVHFSEIDIRNNLYYIKKSLRKILRQIVKYCRYLDDKALMAELHIYFCNKLKNSGIPIKKSQLIVNMYEQELKKINSFVKTLHPDLQGDYNRELEELIL